MNTIEKSVIASPSAESEAVVESLRTGEPIDAEIATRIHEKARRIRDRVFREHGLVDVAVPSIRELRDS